MNFRSLGLATKLETECLLRLLRHHPQRELGLLEEHRHKLDHVDLAVIKQPCVPGARRFIPRKGRVAVRLGTEHGVERGHSALLRPRERRIGQAQPRSEPRGRARDLEPNLWIMLEVVVRLVGLDLGSGPTRALGILPGRRQVFIRGRRRDHPNRQHPDRADRKQHLSHHGPPSGHQMNSGGGSS